MATVTDPDAPFALSSLISDAGVASNGEKLVNSLLFFYPPELKAALEKRENEQLLERFFDAHTDAKGKVDRQALAREASKIAGHDVRHATIRGGEYAEQDAAVTYVYYDERGDAIKGAFPYEHLGRSTSAGHISQLDGLASSPAARDHEHAQAKARAAREASGEAAAAREAEELRAQVEELEAKLAEGAEKPPLEGNATEIASQLRDADRATAERVLEFERGQDEPRSTVTNAAEKRLEVLDDEDKAAAAAAAARETENEALRARVAELEAQAAQAPADPTPEPQSGDQS